MVNSYSKRPGKLLSPLREKDGSTTSSTHQPQSQGMSTVVTWVNFLVVTKEIAKQTEALVNPPIYGGGT